MSHLSDQSFWTNCLPSNLFNKLFLTWSFDQLLFTELVWPNLLNLCSLNQIFSTQSSQSNLLIKSVRPFDQIFWTISFQPNMLNKILQESKLFNGRSYWTPPCWPNDYPMRWQPIKSNPFPQMKHVAEDLYQILQPILPLRIPISHFFTKISFVTSCIPLFEK